MAAKVKRTKKRVKAPSKAQKKKAVKILKDSTRTMKKVNKKLANREQFRSGPSGEQPVIAVKVGEIVPANQIDNVLPGKRYAREFEVIRKLEPGQSVVFAPPQGQKPSVYLNALASSMFRNGLNAPAKCRFVRRQTADGHVAVICEKTRD